MILALLILLCFQSLGEFTVSILNLFIPGPVLGMVFFFISLMIWPPLKERVEGLTRFINANLALFFIPAGVGLIEYFGIFAKYGWALILTLVLSTAVTVAVTALIFQGLLKLYKSEIHHD